MPRLPKSVPRSPRLKRLAAERRAAATTRWWQHAGAEAEAEADADADAEAHTALNQCPVAAHPMAAISATVTPTRLTRCATALKLGRQRARQRTHHLPISTTNQLVL